MGAYLDSSDRPDRIAGGARMIPVTTPVGDFRVWTKRVGSNPDLTVLLLHGGPGATHEYLETCDGYLPAAGIEYYFYDQLGSFYSDQPDDPSLWEIDRFVDEVEQVRLALGLGPESFVLYGQSWGGVLAIEYALAHQQQLKGLVVSNMMASIPAYNRYAEEVLMPEMDQAALVEIKRLEAAGETSDPAYEALLMEHHYVHHVCRLPADEWPDPVVRGFEHINPAIYVPMQGPSELGASGKLEAAKQYESPRYMELLMPHHYAQHILRMPPDQWPEPVNRSFKHLNPKVYIPMQGPSELGASGKLAKWDRTADLKNVAVPTLVIGAQHDTMDPKHMEWMSRQFPRGRYLFCPNGSHMAMYDDQQTYFSGLIAFLKDIDKM